MLGRRAGASPRPPASPWSGGSCPPHRCFSGDSVRGASLVVTAGWRYWHLVIGGQRHCQGSRDEQGQPAGENQSAQNITSSSAEQVRPRHSTLPSIYCSRGDPHLLAASLPVSRWPLLFPQPLIFLMTAAAPWSPGHTQALWSPRSGLPNPASHAIR